MSPKNIDHLTSPLPLFSTPATSAEIAKKTGREMCSVHRTIRRMKAAGPVRPAGWGQHTGRGSIPILWVSTEVQA